MNRWNEMAVERRNKLRIFRSGRYPRQVKNQGLRIYDLLLCLISRTGKEGVSPINYKRPSLAKEVGINSLSRRDPRKRDIYIEGEKERERKTWSIELSPAYNREAANLSKLGVDTESTIRQGFVCLIVCRCEHGQTPDV